MIEFPRCKNCGEQILAVYLLRHTTSDEPVEFGISAKYCPVCGARLDQSETEV